MGDYKGLVTVTSGEQTHLGGNIREGDPHTFAPKVWDYVLDRFAIQSVLDLGSGMGYSARYFHMRGRTVIAVEGLADNVDRALYPTILHDLEKGPVRCSVDLVHCQEVVEHIEEKYLDNLLKSLACGRFVLMTHAVPGQDGFHHVNLQPSEYWISHLRRYGCELLHEDSLRVQRFAKEEGAVFLAANGMIFANRHR